MQRDEFDWDNYFSMAADKEPDPLLLQALPHVRNRGKAVDIGASALAETRCLLAQGFAVTAIDLNPATGRAAALLASDRLSCHVMAFEDFAFPRGEYGLAAALYALPFIARPKFGAVLAAIKESLTEGGVFCGQLFGVRDSWNNGNSDMNFHTREEALGLMQDMEILSFEEEEEPDGITLTGKRKHWHIFHVISRKPQD
jgi:hypothetical protein